MQVIEVGNQGSQQNVNRRIVGGIALWWDSCVDQSSCEGMPLVESDPKTDKWFREYSPPNKKN